MKKWWTGELLVFFLAFPGQAEEKVEVLYERPMTEKEKQGIRVATSTGRLAHYMTSDFHLKQFRSVKWTWRTIKAEFIYRDPQNPKPTHFRRIESGVEVLWERKLAPEEEARYSFSGTVFGLSIYDPKGKMTLEEIRKMFSVENKKWDQGRTVRVELYYPETDSKRPDEVGIKYLGKDFFEELAQKKWDDEVLPKITLGRDTLGFKHAEIYRSWGDALFRVDFTPRADEVLYGPKGQKVSTLIYDGRGIKITIHEFLRLAMRHKYELKKTLHGHVLAIKEPGRKVGKINHPSISRAAWVSDKNLAVFSTGYNLEPEDLVRLYGPIISSSLPGDLKIDKTAWARKEIEDNLERIRKSLGWTRHWTDKDDPFYRPFDFLMEYAYIPADLLPNLPLKEVIQTWPKKEDKKKAFEVIRSWWQENKEDSYWDEGVGKLVVKGQTPREVAAIVLKRKQEKEAAEREALLAKPLTAEDIKAATARLVQYLEKDQEERVRFYNQDGGGKASFKKIKDGLWVFTYPPPPKLFKGFIKTKTISGPKVEKTGEREVPLKAVFNFRYEGKGILNNEIEEYYFYRLKNAWSQTKPKK